MGAKNFVPTEEIFWPRKGKRSEKMMLVNLLKPAITINIKILPPPSMTIDNEIHVDPELATLAVSFLCF